MTKTYIKRFLQIAALVVGACFIYAGFDFFISDDTGAQSRITIHDFYEEDDVDYLFLGPSHSAHMVDAGYLSELTGKNCYNLATTAQYFLNTYYLLEDALEHQKVNNVWVELSFSRFKRAIPVDTATYLITDYLPSWKTRAKMILGAYGLDTTKYINSFFRLRRNLDPLALPEPDSLQEIVKGKRKTKYKEYKGSSSYLGKGQWRSNVTWGYDDSIAFYINTSTSDSFEVGSIPDKAIEYYRKIIELCKKKNVPLTLFVSPYTETYLSLFKDYEDVEAVAMQIAEEYDVPFLDMNLTKEEYLSLHNDDFYNLDHLKSDAGKKVMEFINMYLNDPTKDYFYSSLDEKYPDKDKIMAVTYDRRCYVEGSEEGYKTLQTAKTKGKIKNLVVDVSAYGYHEIKCDIRVTKIDKKDRYGDGIIMEGEKLDDCTVRFDLPYTAGNYYRVEILDPKSKDVVYRAFTDFEMK